jgi:hypothetical protein
MQIVGSLRCWDGPMNLHVYTRSYGTFSSIALICEKLKVAMYKESKSSTLFSALGAPALF